MYRFFYYLYRPIFYLVKKDKKLNNNKIIDNY